MGKKHYNIDEQIIHLEKNKKIIVPNKSDAKIYLTSNNYYNFINPTKYHFISSYKNEKHVYDKSYFNEWMTIDQKFKDLECRIIITILKKERIIASYLNEYIFQQYTAYKDASVVSEFVNLVCFRNKNNFIQYGYDPLKGPDVIIRDITCSEIYKYINDLTLTDLCKILKKTTKGFRKKLSTVLEFNINSDENIVYLSELRNRMAHNTPIIYYFLDKRIHQSAIRGRYLLILDLVKDEKLIDELYLSVRTYRRMLKGKKTATKKSSQINN